MSPTIPEPSVPDPATATAAPSAPAPPTITDHRSRPARLVSPHLQTIAMLSIAALVLGAVFLTPRGPRRPASTHPATAIQTAEPSLVMEFRQRLEAAERAADGARRALADQQARMDQTRATEPSAPLFGSGRADPDAAVDQERRRREYESLFADQLVFSGGTHRVGSGGARGETMGSAPSGLDPAWLAAWTLAQQRVAGPPSATPAAPPPPVDTGPDPSLTGPRTRLARGTILEAVLTTAIDGQFAGPVQARISTPVYSAAGQLVIPAGARLDGQARPVTATDDERLAVTFDQLAFPAPDQRVVPLTPQPALSQAGATGLRDQVDRHYTALFGAAVAVGALSGWSTAIGSAGNDIIVGVGTSTEQTTGRLLEPFLNRRPTHTIRPGHRLRVLLTQDLDLPVYDPGVGPPRPATPQHP